MFKPDPAVNVTTLTFVMGRAAGPVLESLRNTGRVCKSPPPGWIEDAGQLAQRIERHLLQTPRGFEIEIYDGPRLIWQSPLKGAGILYVVQGEQLKTVNLILGREQASGLHDFTRLVQSLSLVDGFRNGLSIVAAAPRPLIATFCSATGELNLQIETAMLTFAAVFFSVARASVARQPISR